MSIQNAAANILYRGVELDTKKRYTEALVCYQEGIQLLVDSLKKETGEKHAYLRNKIEEYMKRAEKIKEIIKELKEKGSYHEQVVIENNSKGYSYETVLGRFLDGEVTAINIEDPYIRTYHQCQNLVRLCELIFKKCKNIKAIHVVTSKDNNSSQQDWLVSLKNNLMKNGIEMDFLYSDTLHDRQIIVSSGWIIKMGRGLDYFKAPENKFCLGVYDLDLRPCHETTINIFHSSTITKREHKKIN